MNLVYWAIHTCFLINVVVGESSEGPFGGSGGEVFTDELFYAEFGGIKEIQISASKYVDYLRFR